jgi:hypothetical protein
MNPRKTSHYKITSDIYQLGQVFFASDDLSLVNAWVDCYMESQTLIRFLLDKAGNFGNQAASANVIARLRQRGFKGRVELIYPPVIAKQLSLLFDIPLPSTPVYYATQSNIVFITSSEFIKQRINGLIEPCTLGFTGAFDGNLENGLTFSADEINKLYVQTELEKLSRNSYAAFLNVEVFTQFSPYYGKHAYKQVNTILQNKHDPHPIELDQSFNQALIVPISSLENAKLFLRTRLNEKNISVNNSQLLNFIDEMEKGEKNFFSLYGWSVRNYPENFFNFILAARYAQESGPVLLKKPLIISVYFEASQRNIDKLQQLILGDFSSILSNIYDSDEQAIVANLEKIHQHFSLPQKVSFTSLSDNNLSLKITKLQSQEILVVFLGHLPKPLFDGLYTYAAPHVFPPVREGANTLTSLLSTAAKPHIYCAGSSSRWEIDTKLANHEVQVLLSLVSYYACPQRQWLKAWGKINIAKLIGGYIVEAHSPDSALSRFFHKQRQYVLKKQNDRIQTSLFVASQLAILSAEDRLQLLKPALYDDFEQAYMNKEDNLLHSTGKNQDDNFAFIQTPLDEDTVVYDSLDNEDISAMFEYDEINYSQVKNNATQGLSQQKCKTRESFSQSFSKYLFGYCHAVLHQCPSYFPKKNSTHYLSHWSDAPATLFQNKVAAKASQPAVLTALPKTQL